ncbi:MAG: hypothetical protein ACD_12C00243G0001 [uncultured bacterium]|nr:MAG: hypothetical protein ACD_12C00243G0001 [uncultured bacterium]
MKDRNFCTIYLTRHGETEWNEKKLIQGHSDIPLNKKGELQAKQLGKELEDVHFDAVFSSDLLRAKNSAEIITLENKLPIVATNALKERFFGRFEGKPLEDLVQTIGEVMTVSKEKQKRLKIYDVESDDDILLRLLPFIKKVASDYSGKNVLMVTHGGLLRAFLKFMDFKIPKYSDHPMKNTGYLIIESDGIEFKLREEKLFN